ncbi:hypothetical protein GGR58DRAFT_494588 [Xylaria digitata]|nr:hypothetical protein GGR58DRAFT_494588 [Xylaria digitata]
MSQSSPAPHSDDPGLGPTISGVSWTFTALAVVSVVIRIVVRYRGPSKLGIDDLTIVLATALQLIFMGFVTEALRWGAGKHDEGISSEQSSHIIKWFWLSTTPALLVAIIARISAAILLIRIFGSKRWFKWFIIIFTVLQTVAGIVTIVTTWTQVQPVEALWDPSVTPTVVRDGSLNDAFVNISGSLFAFTDLSYVFLPSFIIWRLNMPLRRKIGLGIVMSLSFISFVGSVMKPVTTAVAKTQYSSSLVILWSALEQTLVIIITCVPAIRSVVLNEVPLFRYISNSAAHLISGVKSRKSSNASLSLNTDHKQSQYQKRHSGSFGRSLYGSDRERHEAFVSSDSAYRKLGDQGLELTDQIHRRDEFGVNYEAQPENIKTV